MHCQFLKRTGAAVVAALLLSFAVGCGSTGVGTRAANSASSPSSATPTPTTTPAPTPGPTPTPAPAALPPSGIPHSAHVILVIEENHSYAEVLASMPWLVAQGTKYGHTTDYHADNAGSLMDYLWLSSGSCHNAVNCKLPAGTHDFGCGGSDCKAAPITDDNIFRELEKAGLTWKVYAQSLPSVGYLGASSGAYVARHNPAVFYSDVTSNKTLQQKIVPFTQFAIDVAANQLPNYSLIVPDLQHDAHDGTLAAADNFLATSVAPVLQSPPFQAGGDGLMFITFDECDGAVGACPEQVYTAVIGPMVKPGTVSNTYYKHESTLRTMLDALGVSVYPGASNGAPDMTDFF